MSIEANLENVISRMRAQNIDALIVLGRDSYDNEYVSQNEAYLSFITGFKGSSGQAIIYAHGAHQFFTDGRYLNATKLPLCYTVNDDRVKDVLGTVAADPSLHYAIDYKCVSIEEWSELHASAHPHGGSINHANIVEIVWDEMGERPSIEGLPAYYLDHRDTDSLFDKRGRMDAHLVETGSSWALITKLDEIAWLLNIRGSFIRYNPLVRAALFITLCEESDQFEYTLYCDDVATQGEPATVTVDWLNAHRIHLCPYSDIYKPLFTEITSVGIFHVASSNVMMLTNSLNINTPEEFTTLKSMFLESPISEWKSRKSLKEIEGFKQCHIWDGLALAVFLAELELLPKHNHNNERDTEMTYSDRLAKLRSCPKRVSHSQYKGLSFATISASGANGAHPHYSFEDSSNADIALNTFYLVDSGAQYLTGTTDVTRTVYITKDTAPTDSMRYHWTLVLKGMISLASLNFPKGVSTYALDAVARLPLWQAGLDYSHGTSHGVGHHLCVHEFPPLFSSTRDKGSVDESMVISIEPGYYEIGSYGIRHENLVHMMASEKGPPFLAFETLTCCPFSVHQCGDVSLLTNSEKDWINRYHGWVREALLTALGLDYEHNSGSSLFDLITKEQFEDWLMLTTQIL